MNSRLQTRSGATLFVVLAALVLCTSVVITLVNSSLRARRQIRTELQVEQTCWLVDAGVRKGIRECQRDEKYEGETIKLTSLSGRKCSAVIEIKVIGDAREGRSLNVVASLAKAAGDSFATKKSVNVKL